MKHRVLSNKGIALVVILAAVLSGAALRAAAQGASVLPLPDISFRNEAQLAIDHGLLWLQANQNSNGWWSTPEHPALTALAVSAFMGNPSPHAAERAPETVARGYKIIFAKRPPGAKNS